MASRPHHSQRKHSDEIEIANFAAINTHLTHGSTYITKSPSRAQEINMSVTKQGQTTPHRNQSATVVAATSPKQHTAPKAQELTVHAPEHVRDATAGEAVNLELTIASPAPPAVNVAAAKPALSHPVPKVTPPHVETALEVELDVSTTTSAKGNTVLHVTVPVGEKVKVKIHKERAPEPTGSWMQAVLALQTHHPAHFAPHELSAEEEAVIVARAAAEAFSMWHDPKGKIARAEKKAEKAQAKLERQLAHA